MFLTMVSALGQAIWALLSGMFGVVWELLPEILKLRQIAAYCTPTGIIALYIGVPIIVVTIVKLIIKKFLLS